MILNRIEQLEARIQSSTVSEEQKSQLLSLLAAMKEEAAALPSQGTVPVADAEQPIESVLGDIQNSLTGLEASHPRLTQLANQVAVTLSNMGI
jgi:hypothetical protein